MSKIHTNANIQISDKEDPFELKSRPQTIEVKNDIDDDLLTSIFKIRFFNSSGADTCAGYKGAKIP
ncbi:hypothetical protein M3642_23680 [Priestia megaterium]|nr:hypothetical protein [Priestia megaterium]